MTQKNRQDQLFMGEVARNDMGLWLPAAIGIAGETAGWVGGDDGVALCPASVTAGTLVVPIAGLHHGDVLKSVEATGQVESAGGNVTCVMSVRKATAAVADWTDAELGTDNVGTLTADTLIGTGGTALEVLALTETLEDLENLYILLTATTAASTDIRMGGFLITYDKK